MTIEHQRWNIDIDAHYMRYETNNEDFIWCFYRMFELCDALLIDDSGQER